MGDELLRAILANPADDLARLVYADWLDETGDPDRAEFIRVQCDLARYGEHDPRPPELEDREHELLSEHESKWAPVDPEGMVREWEFRRGFVDEVTVNGLDNTLAGLGDSHPVTGLTIIDPRCGIHILNLRRFQPSWMTRVRRMTWNNMNSEFIVGQHRSLKHSFPNLRHLDLARRSDIHLLSRRLLDDPICPQLTSLALGSRTIPDTPSYHPGDPAADLAAALYHSPLESLAAYECGLSGGSLRTLLSAPFAAHLRELDVSDNHLAPDTGVRAFRNANRGMRLRRLDISGTPLGGIGLDSLLECLALDELTALDISRCGSARKNMDVLAASGFWTRATEFRFNHGTVPAHTIEPLCRAAGPPALRLLDLSNNYLRTEGVRMLCDAPWADTITFLSLTRNFLDDESIELLAKSGRFPELRTLHLAHNNVWEPDRHVITDRGVMALADAPTLAGLRLLTLDDAELTDAGLDAVLNGAHWRLSGLSVRDCGLGPSAIALLAGSPRLARLNYLNLSNNHHLSRTALRPLAESPYLPRLCELDISGTGADDATRQALRERLGPRLSD